MIAACSRLAHALDDHGHGGVHGDQIVVDMPVRIVTGYRTPLYLAGFLLGFWFAQKLIEF